MFIHVHEGNKKIRINIHHITWYEESRTGHCTSLCIGNRRMMEVRETPEEVDKLIAEARQGVDQAPDLRLDEIADAPSPVTKPPEEVLEIDTIVIVRGDIDQTHRKITAVIPDEVYPHRYIVEGWSFVCQFNDLIVVL